jgi:uncharacterized protein (UPF0332 family)
MGKKEQKGDIFKRANWPLPSPQTLIWSILSTYIISLVVVLSIHPSHHPSRHPSIQDNNRTKVASIIIYSSFHSCWWVLLIIKRGTKKKHTWILEKTSSLFVESFFFLFHPENLSHSFLSSCWRMEIGRSSTRSQIQYRSRVQAHFFL